MLSEQNLETSPQIVVGDLNNPTHIKLEFPILSNLMGGERSNNNKNPPRDKRSVSHRVIFAWENILKKPKK